MTRCHYTLNTGWNLHFGTFGIQSTKTQKKNSGHKVWCVCVCVSAEGSGGLKTAACGMSLKGLRVDSGSRGLYAANDGQAAVTRPSRLRNGPSPQGLWSRLGIV